MPVVAQAHAPYPGFRGFYVGFLHPLTIPSHILLIIALSLYLGSRLGGKPVHCLISLFAATATGLLLAFVIAPLLPTGILILVFTTLTGIALLISPQPRDSVFVLIAGLGGFLLAMESIPDPGAFGDIAITTVGALVGIHYLIMYGTRLVAMALEKWNVSWMRIGVRVVGSWITAIGCLMLAFNLAGIA